MGADKGRVFEIFSRGKEPFPMVEKALANTPGSMKRRCNNADTMKVIWVERDQSDENLVRVLCEMTAKEGGIVNAYLARAVNGSGVCVAEASFVCFDENTAFAELKVPETEFAACSVVMELAAISNSVRTAQCSVALEPFDIETIQPEYKIKAPVVTRPGIQDDQIRISYYEGVPKSRYDYVYPGQRENQLYFPSEGEIAIPNVKLEKADLILSIEGGYDFIDYPGEPEKTVEDNVISYCFQEKWNRKMTDCFGNNRQHADVKYKLEITAKKTNGRILTLLITNMKQLSEDEKYDSIKMIPKIDAYVDCFLEGTRILMADGSRKAVEELLRGACIRSGDGRAIEVQEVVKQENRQIVKLILENDDELSLTEGHAVYTEDGILPVYRLKDGQKVMTEDGPCRIKHILPCCEQAYPVYSVFLADQEGSMFANRMMVHHSDSASVFKGRDWVREDLPAEWLDDYDHALKAGIVYGR